MEGIGEDVLQVIVSFCTCSEAFRLGQTCKWLQQNVEKESVLQQAFTQEFVLNGKFIQHKGVSLKEQARNLHLLSHLPNALTRVSWRELEEYSHLDARQGSSMASTDDGELAVLFGGWTLQYGITTDVWVFEANSLRWKFAFILAQVRPRYGHVLTYLGKMENMHEFIVTGGVVMGGYVGACNGITKIGICPDFKMSTACETRPAFDLQGEGCGTRRAYHSATRVMDGNALVLFGGFDEDGPITSLEIYDVEKDMFIPIPNQSGDLPCARFGHTCTMLRGNTQEATLLVCGGTQDKNNMKVLRGNVDLDDAFILQLRRESETSFSARWDQIQRNNFRCPSEILQRLHSATLVGAKTLILFGGGRPGNTTNKVSFVHVPDNLLQEEWAFVAGVQVEGLKAPVARQNHSAVWLKNNRILIFGGCLAGPFQEELGDTFLLELCT